MTRLSLCSTMLLSLNQSCCRCQDSPQTAPRTHVSPATTRVCSRHRNSFAKLLVALISAAQVWTDDSSLAVAISYDPVPSSERIASNAFTIRVAKAVENLEEGRRLQAQGDYAGALASFSRVIEEAGDLGVAEYARVGHALSLYELGRRDDAIVEMEDVSVSLKGYPEVHAALAAALYVDKHAPELAEKQFTIATLLDPRYTEIEFVRESRHWPPSLVQSLVKFIRLE